MDRGTCLTILGQLKKMQEMLPAAIDKIEARLRKFESGTLRKDGRSSLSASSTDGISETREIAPLSGNDESGL